MDRRGGLACLKEGDPTQVQSPSLLDLDEPLPGGGIRRTSPPGGPHTRQHEHGRHRSLHDSFPPSIAHSRQDERRVDTCRACLLLCPLGGRLVTTDNRPGKRPTALRPLLDALWLTVERYLGTTQGFHRCHRFLAPEVAVE